MASSAILTGFENLSGFTSPLLMLVFNDSIAAPMYDAVASSNKKGSESDFFEEFEEVGVELMNIYPNPAQDAVSISYTLPEKITEATLSVYSLEGKRIETIKLNTAENVLSLNVSNLSNGFYVYLLTADGRLIARKKLAVTK